MSNNIDVIRTIKDLRTRVSAWRMSGKRVGLVPTMGDLHKGHLALVKSSLKSTDRTIVTIFVNPKQFSPSEDFSEYPRNEECDIKLLNEEGVNILFAPQNDEMYPENFLTSVLVPKLSEVLEGKSRPGFFTGVSTIVTKILMQTNADMAFFGEKDYQQFRVIKKLVLDLDIPTEIVGVTTIREDDGLAFSSRNRYLTTDGRKKAPKLYWTLSAVAQKIKQGEEANSAEIWGQNQLLNAGFDHIDYISARSSVTLECYKNASESGRIFGAARIGEARLIDNVAI